MKKILVLFSVLFLSVNCFAKGLNDKVTIKNGITAVEYVPYNGGVFIYAEGLNKKYVPLIDVVDYAASSFIGVAIDKTYYNLRDSGGVKYKYEIENNVLLVTYKIKNQVELTISYEISNKNIIEIKYAVKNIDGSKHAVSIKSIFDTVLGEGKDGSYLTAVKSSINSEYIISDFSKHKYITSTDGKLAIRFLFDEPYSKYAYKTVIAAKPFFESTAFEGRFVEGRGFNTVLSYNNSCIGCFFKTLKLNPGDEKVIGQKIQILRNEFAVNEKDSDDGFYDNSNGDEEYYSDSQVKSADDLVEEKHNFSFPVEKQDDVSKNDDILLQNPSEESVISESDFTSPDKPDFAKPETKEVKPAKTYSKEDALELIRKIDSLNDDGTNTNTEEVLKLQMELENILKILKNK